MDRCACGAPLVAGVLPGLASVCWVSGWEPETCEQYRDHMRYRPPHAPWAVKCRQKWITRVRRIYRAQREA